MPSDKQMQDANAMLDRLTRTKENYTPTPAFHDVMRTVVNPFSKNILAFENVNELEEDNMLMGRDIGIIDSGTYRHPSTVKLFQEYKVNDWTWWEFEFQRCIKDWKTVSPDYYNKMVKTIAWQWEGDTLAAVGQLAACSAFITDASCLEMETRIADGEVLHARSYAQITNNSFADPMAVRREILTAQTVQRRLYPVSRAMQLVAQVGYEYKLGLRENNQDTYNYALFYEAVLYILEKIQFNAAFLMTHLLTMDGSFAPIATCIQKIAVDELRYHVPHRKYVITNELTTPRGQAAWAAVKPVVQRMFDLVVESELEWVQKELFADGKELPGGDANTVMRYVLWCAHDVAKHMDLDSAYDLPTKTPVASMERWLDPDNKQSSPQDQSLANYNVIQVVKDEAKDDSDLLDLL